MNQAPTQARPAPNSTSSTQQIIKRWDQGQPANARAALEQNPELAGDRNAVFKLAYEEFCSRSENGEDLDRLAFADQFPICRSALVKTFMSHGFVEANPTLAHAGDWPQPGDEFLGFTVKGELGTGGFARVYLANETALGNRPVVLKVSLRGGGAEAEILGRLRHDNIVPVYSIHKDDLAVLTVVCMPYLGKTTLCDVLDHAFGRPGVRPEKARVILEAVQPDQAEEDLARCEPSTTLLQGTYVEGVVEFGIQLADALAFVHDRKIFHRDLKPSNVLVRPDGQPMLLDFNLSFDLRAGEQTLGGTLLYMSPEQLRATEPKDTGPCLLDARSDLYSLGVILFELLAGERPFGPVVWKGSPEQIRPVLSQRQQAGPKSLRQANPQVDKRLARVVEKCLAPRPQDRFQSASQLADALRQCDSRARRPGRWLGRNCRKTLVTLVAGLCLAAFLTVVLALRPPDQYRPFQQGLQAFQEGNYSLAIAHFDRALAQGVSARTYLARGRALLMMGNVHAAREDFQAADKLRPSGQAKACLAHCLSRHKPGQWAAAGFYYEKAIREGFATATVYNNLGYCLLMQDCDFDAEKALDKALVMDPSFQMAHYNRARVDLKRGAIKPSLMSAGGMSAMAKVFETGPATGLVHENAARLYVLAAQRVPPLKGPEWKELALKHLQQAITAGARPADVKRDEIFQQLGKEPPFQRLLQMAAVVPTRPLVDLERTQDPFLNLPD